MGAKSLTGSYGTFVNRLEFIPCVPFVPRSERVAVRRALRHDLGAHHAVRAAPVLDDDLLTPGLGQLLADDARQDIRRSARTERNHDANGLRRVRLRARADAGQRQHDCGSRTKDERGRMKDDLIQPAAPLDHACFSGMKAQDNAKSLPRLRMPFCNSQLTGHPSTFILSSLHSNLRYNSDNNYCFEETEERCPYCHARCRWRR